VAGRLARWGGVTPAPARAARAHLAAQLAQGVWDRVASIGFLCDRYIVTITVNMSWPHRHLIEGIEGLGMVAAPPAAVGQRRKGMDGQYTEETTTGISSRVECSCGTARSAMVAFGSARYPKAGPRSRRLLQVVVLMQNVHKNQARKVPVH
jgi:hypothetical protein